MSAQRVLICGVNWIGDTIMSMPAIQEFRRRHPEDHLALLVKPGLRGLWELHAAPDEILSLESCTGGMFRTVRSVREKAFNTAYVLPHSFRSSLIPLLARIPVRVGMPGHSRDWMLTDIVAPRGGEGREHQAYEYYDLLFPAAASASCEPPELSLPDELLATVKAKVPETAGRCVALLPGAARGPSKQWPEEHFIEAGRRLAALPDCTVLVCGSPAEREACDRIAAEIGARAVSVAGRTNLREWAGLLSLCSLVVCNDSGGMHIAAAVGTPVVAVFGTTDPAKTGPLTDRCRILQYSNSKSRDIGRDSKDARLALASVRPEEVVTACMEFLRNE
ncbi:MAG: lipopolysaccharide heptosyltransferase II [Verrucomicrobia bacterium]|nr:lipopolysaccharide heptosyltransferase II [Verrucomicrobiota bacterium]